MIHLSKREGSPHWQAHLKDPRVPEGIVRRTTKTSVKAQARRVAESMQAEIDDEIEAETNARLSTCGMTWLDALLLFLDEGSLEPSTRRSYVHIGKTVAELLGDFDLGTLTHERLKTFCNQRRQQTVCPPGATDTGRRISDQTIRNNLSTISAVYKHVMDRGYETAPKINPLKNFDRGFLKNSKIVDRHLRPMQFQQCIDACKTPTHRAMLMLMVGTGMRSGEVLSLYWAEIDFQTKIIEFGNVDPDRTKTSRSRRIALLEPVIVELAAHRAAQIAAGEFIRDGLVFGNPKTGKRRYDLKYLIKLVRARTGIQRYWNHGLRHTFASWALQQGIDPKAIQLGLGHKTMSTTDHYAHHIGDTALAQLRTLELPSTTQTAAQSSGFSESPLDKKENMPAKTRE